MMNKCILSVCDDTGNGRIVQLTNQSDDLEIGQYYELYANIKIDK